MDNLRGAEGDGAGAAGRSLDTPYCPVRPAGPIDLHLDANEACASAVDMAGVWARLGPDGARRYPNAASLERAIAEKHGVSARRVLVTAGGDEAIDRACRVFLGAGLEIALPVPTFEMIERYARRAGASVVATAWGSGRFPTDAVLDSVGERTRMIAVVSPNNPTGAVAAADDLERLSRGAPGCVLLVDLAYTEFADEDLTGAALALPNAVLIRTFSKAFGLAGMRVGYAVGSEERILSMRAVAGPYPVSGLSLAAAEDALARERTWIPRVVGRARAERAGLSALLRELGASPAESQGNFVLAEFKDAGWVWRALAGVGIAVRGYAGHSLLDRCLRITCPGDEAAFARLARALRSAMRPEAILFDLDHVNQWAAGRERDGLAGRSGPTAMEDAADGRAVLGRLGRRLKLGLMTRRPRRDAERELDRHGLRDLVGALVSSEDAPAAGAPAVVMSRLGCEAAWMVARSPGEVAAARAAGAIPIGVTEGGEGRTGVSGDLERAGAARVLRGLSEIEGMIP